MVEKLGQPLHRRDREHVEPRVPVLRRGDGAVRPGRRRGARASSWACPLLGEVPLEPALREGSDSGEPVFIERPRGAASQAIAAHRRAHRRRRPAPAGPGASPRRSPSSRADRLTRGAPPHGGLRALVSRRWFRAEATEGQARGLSGRARLIGARDSAHASGKRSAVHGRDRAACLARAVLSARRPGTCCSRTFPVSARRRSRSIIARAIGGHDCRIQCTARPDRPRRASARRSSREPGAARPTSSSRARCSRTPSSSTSSTAPRRACRRPCSRPWRSRSSRSASAATRCRSPFFCIATHESARQQGHVRHAARPARPLRDLHRHGLPVRERRGRSAHALRLRRHAGRTSTRSSRPAMWCSCSEVISLVARRRAGARLPRAPAALHARASGGPRRRLAARDAVDVPQLPGRCSPRQRHRGRRQARAQPVRALHRPPHPRASRGLRARRVRGNPGRHARAGQTPPPTISAAAGRPQSGDSVQIAA